MYLGTPVTTRCNELSQHVVPDLLWSSSRPWRCLTNFACYVRSTCACLCVCIHVCVCACGPHVSLVGCMSVCGQTWIYPAAQIDKSVFSFCKSVFVEV